MPLTEELEESLSRDWIHADMLFHFKTKEGREGFRKGVEAEEGSGVIQYLECQCDDDWQLMVTVEGPMYAVRFTKEYFNDNAKLVYGGYLDQDD